jgi:hypothetical protein
MATYRITFPPLVAAAIRRDVRIDADGAGESLTLRGDETEVVREFPDGIEVTVRSRVVGRNGLVAAWSTPATWEVGAEFFNPTIQGQPEAVLTSQAPEPAAPVEDPIEEVAEEPVEPEPQATTDGDDEAEAEAEMEAEIEEEDSFDEDETEVEAELADETEDEDPIEDPAEDDDFEDDYESDESEEDVDED